MKYFDTVYCDRDPREGDCSYWTSKGPITSYEANSLILIHGWALQKVVKEVSNEMEAH